MDVGDSEKAKKEKPVSLNMYVGFYFFIPFQGEGFPRSLVKFVNGRDEKVIKSLKAEENGDDTHRTEYITRCSYVKLLINRKVQYWF